MCLYVRTPLSTFDHMPMLKCIIQVLNACKTRDMKKTVVVHIYWRKQKERKTQFEARIKLSERIYGNPQMRPLRPLTFLWQRISLPLRIPPKIV